MQCYGAKELSESFRTVRNNTLKIAEEIGENNYGFRAAPDTRTVAQTLVHIALSPHLAEQIHVIERRTTLVGFDFPAFMGRMVADEQMARTKAQILGLLREGGDRFAGQLAGLPDDFLAERVTFPEGMTPASKTRFEMLLGPKEHEMHHRGQLMLMERMLGMVPHLTRDFQARVAAMQAQTAKSAG